MSITTEQALQLVGIGSTILLAGLVLTLSFYFGRKIYERTSVTLFDQSGSTRPNANITDARSGASPGSVNWLTSIATSAFEYRNIFWYVYTQLSVAILIVTLLVILLIMNIVTPDAALPLIAAVGAYLLGRGTQTQTGGRPVDGQTRPVPEAEAPRDERQ